jgi:hypothetical protein
MKKLYYGVMGVVLALPGIAMATDPPFTVTLPTFDWTLIGTIGVTMLGVGGALVVYRKVRSVMNRG